MGTIATKEILREYDNDYIYPSLKAQTSLLRDTVGWTGKNQLEIPASVVTTTINDVAFTVNRNANGEVTSIVANGTASNDAVLRIAPHTVNAPTYAEELPIARANYKYSCLSSAGSDSTYFSTAIARTSSEASREVIGTDRGSGATFTINNDTTRIEFNITVKKNQQVSNVVFYPMLRSASIADPTYEPYHESVETMFAEEIHGVNLLEVTASTQTKNGVTFTVNADKSITLNGTATNNAVIIVTQENDPELMALRGDYILSAGVSVGSVFVSLRRNDNTYVDLHNASDILVHATDASYFNRLHIWVGSGVTVNNLKLSLMLRKAEIDDSTYRPYNPQAIQNQINDKAVLGAKNHFVFTPQSRTSSGITFVVDNEGIVTANGTATSDAFINLWGDSYVKNEYIGQILSGVKGGSNSTYMLSLNYSNNGSSWAAETDLFSGEKIVENYPYIRPTFMIRQGQTVNNLKIYPMLRLASDPDDTYVPYAMTNKELTDKTNELANNVNIINSALNIGSISENDDLNNYYITGEYNADTADIASTIINKPSDLTKAFQLRVINRGKTKNDSLQIRTVTQIIECINENSSDVIYKRTKSHNASSWGPWYKFTGTEVT